MFERDLDLTHLDKPGVEEDPCTERIESARRSSHGSTVGVQRFPHTKTDGDTEGAVIWQAIQGQRRPQWFQ